MINFSYFNSLLEYYFIRFLLLFSFFFQEDDELQKYEKYKNANFFRFKFEICFVALKQIYNHRFLFK